MTASPPRPPTPHPYRRRGRTERIRGFLSGIRAVERTAWHTGELLHRRPEDPTPGRRTPVDIGDRYAGGTVPQWPTDAPRAPSRLTPAAGLTNPVLTAADVTDFGNADCVADPFLLPDGDTWHLFFEVYNHQREPTAAIAHATSDDGYEWTYDRVVVETDEHLSFPYVFRWDGEYYLVPDRWAKTRGVAGVTLYRAESFPHQWEPVADLVQPATDVHDFAPFRWDGRWWALAGDGRDLYAYHSDTLEAEWEPHAGNPVVADRRIAARPAGRPLVFEDRIVVFLQDTADRYGERVRAYAVTTLSPEAYADREQQGSPVLEPTGGLGWNSGAMHTVDPWYDGSGYLCAVDGTIGAGYQVFGDHHWAIGIYRG
ncbi:hypothetical protein [Halapricum sp. CBA1109]|uniref:glucosamine inositolphosphorylceramide transferase family protein n=1 Tax=Halapricum sp. CBA1109 TaxID=2668068 RepID=UPI0018D1F7D5|nr:hypothetical protein [Halapricum sp. CBA1109]